MNKGYVSKIETLSLVDGPGIRVVVFLSGCNRRCIYCHNPEMLNIASGKIYSTGELFSIIMKYKPYFGNNGGVTFSGGEPLLQKNFLKQMIKLCHNNGINICIETAGLEVEDNVIENIDLIILDL
ncbi:MAG: 4Fe-4S cluster-binding domain-containing protein, partial [bacterium]|nr:4Fe-4S cluster-binding domain-containing protein [bacterium]